MQTIKATLSAVVLAALSFTSGVEQSFAGVATPAAATPALTDSQGSVEQVFWRGGGGWHGGGWHGGWRGGGWHGGGWHGGWGGGWHRGWGWGGAPYWGGYGYAGCWQPRWTPWGWRRAWVC